MSKLVDFFWSNPEFSTSIYKFFGKPQKLKKAREDLLMEYYLACQAMFHRDSDTDDIEQYLYGCREEIIDKTINLDWPKNGMPFCAVIGQNKMPLDRSIKFLKRTADSSVRNFINLQNHKNIQEIDGIYFLICPRYVEFYHSEVHKVESVLYGRGLISANFEETIFFMARSQDRFLPTMTILILGCHNENGTIPTIEFRHGKFLINQINANRLPEGYYWACFYNEIYHPNI